MYLRVGRERIAITKEYVFTVYPLHKRLQRIGCFGNGFVISSHKMCNNALKQALR